MDIPGPAGRGGSTPPLRSQQAPPRPSVRLGNFPTPRSRKSSSPQTQRHLPRPAFFSSTPPQTPSRKSPRSTSASRTRIRVSTLERRREPPRHRASARVRLRACGSDPAGEMLGGLLSKILLLLFGYAMPAFECFKTVEERPNDALMLRFWCQYWIIVSMVIAVEGLISWMPMYGEIKLAFFVYLWYPKTKGSDVVYDTFLRPIVMQYEPNIEQRLLHLRAQSGPLLSFYAKNFADKGTAFFMDMLRYVVSDKAEGSNLEQRNKKSGWSPFATKRRPPSPPPPQERLFDNPDAAVVAEVLRAAINPKPRRAHDGKDY